MTTMTDEKIYVPTARLRWVRDWAGLPQLQQWWAVSFYSESTGRVELSDSEGDWRGVPTI